MQNHRKFYFRITNPILATICERASAANMLWGNSIRLPNEPKEILRLCDLSLSRSLTLFKHLFTIPIERKLPPDEVASIKRIFIQSQKTGTQSLLYATIMISPLILLLPINLINLRWSRESLL